MTGADPMTQMAVFALVLSAVLGLGAACRVAVASCRRSHVTGRLGAGPGGTGRLGAGAPAPALASGGSGAVGGWASWRGRALRVPAPPQRFVAALADAAVPVAPALAWWAWVAVVSASGLGVVAAGAPGLAAVTALALGVGPALVLRSRRGAASAAVEQALPVALESVARSLRSGASLRQAVEEAGAAVPARASAGARALAAELARAAAEAAQGASLVASLEAVAVRRPLPGVRLGVAALCLGAETGGAQARAVDGVAATVRERLAVTAELRALASQARMSALVIGLAPVGFGAFAAVTDPRTAQFMFRTPAGLGLLAAGLALDAAGWLWMQRLARVAP